MKAAHWLSGWGLFWSLTVVAGETPERNWQTHCSHCHGPERLGLTAPPLLPETLKKIKPERIRGIISKGLPATRMPAFGASLSAGEINDLARWILRPARVAWSHKDIHASITLTGPKDFPVKSPPPPLNTTAVVERGKNRIWIMNGDQVIDRFAMERVHGGLKFSADHRFVLVPTRDGRVGQYLQGQGYRGHVRPCIALRNVAIARDSRTILAPYLLPAQLVTLDARSLKPVRSRALSGKISAIYALHSRDEAVFTYRDKPGITILDTRDGSSRVLQTAEPIEDYFIDPWDRHLIGSSRKGSRLLVVDLQSGKEVFSTKVEGMPHLASAAFWYDDGKFYFATSHIRKPRVSVWEMLDWRHVKDIPTGTNGFFVRTHQGTPWLWADRGRDGMLLIDKKTLETQTLTIATGKQVMHTEFSGDGHLAYISVYEPDGELTIVDSQTLRVRKRMPASIPVGKYNIVNKQRRFHAPALGQSVFMHRCWGCHHETEMAFGPSLAHISSRRTDGEIRAWLANPELMARHRGKSDAGMPEIRLNPTETDVLLRYIRWSEKGLNL